MKKLWFILSLVVFLFGVVFTSCTGDDEDRGCIVYQVGWVHKDTVYDGPDMTVYEDNVYLFFNEYAFPAPRLEYVTDVIYGGGGIVEPYGRFEILGEVKLLSEWNECSIKLPPDTAKKWLFKFVKKDNNNTWSWDFLYDRNYEGDSLVFWDSTNNIKCSFRKYIAYSRVC